MKWKREEDEDKVNYLKAIMTLTHKETQMNNKKLKSNFAK